MRTLWEHAQKKDGGHALSNVELTIDDGVNVASGRIRHAGWMVVYGSEVFEKGQT